MGRGNIIFVADIDGGLVKKDQEILLWSFFSARNLLPVNEKTAWGGGLVEG